MHPSHSTSNRPHISAPHISAQARHEGYHTLRGRLLRDSGWLPHHGSSDGDEEGGLRIGLTLISSAASP